MSDHTPQNLSQAEHRSAKTDRTYIQIPMSVKSKAFIEGTVRKIGYASMSEFVRDAIRRRLEQLGFNTDEVLFSGVEKPIE